MLTFLFLFVLICVFSSWPGPQEKNTKHKTANEQCEKCRQIKYFQARNLSAWQVKEKKKTEGGLSQKWAQQQQKACGRSARHLGLPRDQLLP